MADTQAYLLFVFFVLVQVSAARKRWALPVLRGPEWFFGVQVGSGFYSGEGRRILRNYRLWIMAPYVLETIAAIVVLRFGKPQDLLYLMLILVLVIVGNSVAATVITSRQARRFELPGSIPTASAVAFSLKTRRLWDYTSGSFELSLGLLNAAALTALATGFRRVSHSGEVREMIGVPLLLCYLQAGLLLAKSGLVAWRMAVPRENPEPYLEWRERSRRFWIDVCDVLRAGLAGLLIFGVFLTGLDLDPVLASWVFVAVVLAALAVWTVRYARRRDQYLAAFKLVQPIKLPVLEEETKISRPFCYLPARPVMLVRSAPGYTLNLGSSRTQIGVLYLAGLAAMIFWLRLR